MIRGWIKPRARRTRRGYALYALVMSVTLIVSLLGLSALTVLRIERRSNGRKHEMADARRYALAAVEMGLTRIKNDSNWRTTYTSGVWESNRPIGDGTYTLEGIDTSDGNLANSQIDPVVLIGIGRVGSVTQKFQVTMVSDPKGLSCLEVAAHADLNVLFWDGTVDCDQIMSSNDNVYNSGGTVNSNVEAVNYITGSYNGDTDTGIDIREMPNPTTVFDYYIANGTAISYLSLPSEESFRKLENVVLSPSITNPQGIYVINCHGLEILVQDCRIVGTLVLLDTHPNSQIGLSVNWEPAVENYPALLVRGPIQLSCDGSELDEAEQGVNFNPASTP